MGSLASSCVRDCVRTTHEYAGEAADPGTKDLLSISVEPPGMATGSGSRAGAGATTGGTDAPGSSAVPPVPNWFQVLHDGRRNKEVAGTPRFDEATPRVPDGQATPHEAIGGEFRTPRLGATPRDSPRTSEGVNGDGGKIIDEVSYEGTYLGTMKHGTGTLRMTSSLYRGSFENDSKHGQGVLTWDDGRRYRGGFQSDKFHGMATMLWPDGRKYSGLYKDDRKHGDGVFTWQDGRRYDGQWVGGKRHGIGTYTNAKGVTRRGTWQLDRPIMWESPGAELQPLPVNAGQRHADGGGGSLRPTCEVVAQDRPRLEVSVEQTADSRAAFGRVPLHPHVEVEEMDLAIKVAPPSVALR